MDPEAQTRLSIVGAVAAGTMLLLLGSYAFVTDRELGGLRSRRRSRKGKVRCIGRACRRRTTLDRLEWDAPTRTATIFVGQNKGKQERSNAGTCRRGPNVYQADSIDRHFKKLRASQVGSDNVGATRTQNRGWYEGAREASVAYQVIHNPFVPGEESWDTFKSRMSSIAERLAKNVCQDEVLVTFDDGSSKHTYSYSSL